MTPDKGGPGSVFGGDGKRSKPGRTRGRAPAKDKETAKRKVPPRPMAELNARLAKEGKSGPRRPFRQRLANAFPLFGLLGVREIGLIIAIIGAVTMILVWSHLRPWGLVVVGLGFVIMRYGDAWLKGE